VEAAPIINGFGLDNPTETITFNGTDFPIGTEITTQYSGLGVNFSNLFVDYAALQTRQRNSTDKVLSNFDVTRSGPFGPFSINFLQQQTDVAFLLRTNLGISTFTALLNGVVIETFNAETVLLITKFYGFSGILFDEIQVNPGGSNTAAGIDNLQLSPLTSTSVPETSSVLGLLSMGALSIGFCHKRRQKTTSNLSR
jgi:hypothetical protein